MADKASFRDIEDARQNGAAFGWSIGRETAAAMTAAEAEGGDVPVIGAEGAGKVLAEAAALADAGLEQDLVDAWTDSAADAFTRELDRTATLLTAPGSKH